MLACFVFYAAAGAILGALPAPYWVWIIALGAVLIQAAALAGPKNLARFRWWFANLLVIFATVGAGGLAAAIAIAFGFSGSKNLDETLPHELVGEVIQYSLVALGLAALCAGLTAATGDRLIRTYRRFQTSLIVAATCVLGLALGGFMGLSLT